MEPSLLLNGKVFYYDEISEYSFRNSIPINGYEAKTLELCRDWLNGIQEFSIQTSGSTGAPKLITLSRQQLEASAKASIYALKMHAGDRALVCLNTETIGGLMLLVRGFMAKMHLTIIEPTSNPLAVLSSGVMFDFASFVPLQLQEMLLFPSENLPFLNHMKAILVGGAAVSGKLLTQLRQIQAPVFHTYGMTETVSHIALKRLNGPNASEYFKVMPGVEIGMDERGCLTIKGEVTLGEKIITNDVVNLLDAETFEWLGRADFIFNSGGVKIQAEKVEKTLELALEQMGLNLNSFITAVPDEKLGEKIIAVFEIPELDNLRASQLKAKLQQLLSRYEVPKQFYFLPTFKQTSSGKLDRKKTLEFAISYGRTSKF